MRFPLAALLRMMEARNDRMDKTYGGGKHASPAPPSPDDMSMIQMLEQMRPPQGKP